ncbi:MAG: hypothetical protein UV34_C0002G0017 [Parcubacteria group bacterium GW2011_GWB1_42_6]|nr:MAG: hypothetical protein UV34_C0002G0017 [Parcubacteria group bacterium GW2011_GWB1_42_6]
MIRAIKKPKPRTKKVCGFFIKTKTRPNGRVFKGERVTGVEPVYRPWQGRVIPIYHTRRFRQSDNGLSLIVNSINFSD